MGTLVSAPLDASMESMAIVVDRWRSMSASDRFETVASLNDACQAMAEAGVRLRFPLADDHEVWLRVTALRLGRALMVDVYRWDPDVEGW